MTPTELRAALDLIDHTIAGDATPEQRVLAHEHLTVIRGLLSDVRSGPDDVLIGRQASFIKPSPATMKLQLLAPKGNGGAIEGMVRCVESQEGTRGHREITPITFVFDDGRWTDVLLPTKPQDAGFQSFRRELTPSLS